MKAAWLRNNVPRGMCWRSAKWTIRSRVRAKSGFESLFQESTRGDVKKRGDAFGVGMPYRRVIPHSDGSGTVDTVGEGVSLGWVGRRVWCFGAQSYRPFGTAAQYTVVPL